MSTRERTLSWPAGEEFATRHVTINGQQVGYRLAGSGPLIVLIHGLAGSSATWRRVGPPLAAHHTVLAVDLIGHGESDKPRGDYSLGAHASSVRDLMMTLGLDAATFVGHSLGGGVAMVLAYQFPELCQRLVLVASGGLGKEVTPLLRAASLPGAELVLPVVLSGRIRGVLVAAGSPFRRIGLRLDGAPSEWWNHYASLTTREARVAFLSTVREVIDLRGQRVSAADRLYLAAELPTLIVWGDRDGVIPVAHAHRAHEALPGSRLEILEGSGHFIPVHDGERLADLIADFVATTEPASTNGSAFRVALRRGSLGAAAAAAAAAAGAAGVVAPVASLGEGEGVS